MPQRPLSGLISQAEELATEATLLLRRVRKTLDMLFPSYTGNTGMGLLNDLLMESMKVAEAWQSKDADALLEHFCHIVEDLTEATPSEVDDRVHWVVHNVMQNESVRQYVVGWLSQRLWGGEVIAFSPDPRCAKIGLTPSDLEKVAAHLEKLGGDQNPEPEVEPEAAHAASDMIDLYDQVADDEEDEEDADQ